MNHTETMCNGEKKEGENKLKWRWEVYSMETWLFISSYNTKQTDKEIIV